MSNSPWQPVDETAAWTPVEEETRKSWGERHPLAREAALGALSSASGLPEDIRAYGDQPRPSTWESVKEGIKSGFPVVGALQSAYGAGKGLYEAGKSLIPSNAMADPEAAAHGLGSVLGYSAVAAAPESEAVGRTAARGVGRVLETAGRRAAKPIDLGGGPITYRGIPLSPASIVGAAGGGAVGSHVIPGFGGYTVGVPAGMATAVKGAQALERAGGALRRLGSEPRVSPPPLARPSVEAAPQFESVTLPGGTVLVKDAEGNWTSPNAPKPKAVGGVGGDLGRPATESSDNPNVATTLTRPTLSPAPETPPEATVVRSGVPLSTTPVAVEPGEFESGEQQPAGLGYGLNGPDWFEQGGSGRARGLGGPARVAVTPPEALEQNPALVVGRKAENQRGPSLRSRRIVAGLPPEESPAQPTPTEEDLTGKLRESIRLAKEKRKKQ